jgi:hypothetical protein
MSNPDKLQKIHNQGQVDASNRKNNPPHLQSEIFIRAINPFGFHKSAVAENEAYESGQIHHREQTKGK